MQAEIKTVQSLLLRVILNHATKGNVHMPLQSGNQLRGLVDGLGSGGASVGNTDKWSLVFHLVAWRDDKNIRIEKLRCEMPVTKPVLADFMKLIRPYSIIEARIKDFTSNGAAVLEAVQVFAGEDGELTTVKDELLTPVRIDTPHFGVLELDRRFGEYVGQIDWCGSNVSLCLSCSDHNAPEAVLAVADTLFSARRDWSMRVKEFAADRMLSLKNDNWLHDDESDLSREDFISCMTLTEISIDESGSFTFSNDDGDLFWGHSIAVSGNIADGLKDAEI